MNFLLRFFGKHYIKNVTGSSQTDLYNRDTISSVETILQNLINPMEEVFMKKFLVTLSVFAVIAGSASVLVSQPALAEEANCTVEAYETISPRWPQHEPVFPLMATITPRWPQHEPVFPLMETLAGENYASAVVL